MPLAALRVCAEPHCTALVTSGRCLEHAKPRRQEQRRHYTGSASYGRPWRRLRLAFIYGDPVKNLTCAHCHQLMDMDEVQVDHIVPHKGDEQLRTSFSNLQSLCLECHSRKTAKEVGLGGAF